MSQVTCRSTSQVKCQSQISTYDFIALSSHAKAILEPKAVNDVYKTFLMYFEQVLSNLKFNYI